MRWTEGEVEATPKNLRSFGVVGGAILGVFTLLAWRKGSPTVPWLAGFGVLAAGLGLAAPVALAPIFRVWMKAAGVIALVNTWLILAFVFYAVLTPFALLARLFGRDPLDEKLGTGESYWHDKEPVTDPRVYERQF